MGEHDCQLFLVVRTVFGDLVGDIAAQNFYLSLDTPTLQLLGQAFQVFLVDLLWVIPKTCVLHRMAGRDM